MWPDRDPDPFDLPWWTHPLVAILAVAIAAVAGLLLMDMVTNHEPPSNLPDCTESQVLDYAPGGYVEDPAQRIYKCVEANEIGE